MVSEVEFLPLIPDAEQFICVGANYKDHLEEARAANNAQVASHDNPGIFIRVPQSLCGHMQPLILPSVSEQLDFECELAVIIGKRGRHIPKGKSFEHIVGFSCFNDGSVRDWQRHTSQVTAGKNFAATGAFGPWLVTKEEISAPLELQIRTLLNGEVMQRANTRDMIFDIPTIVSYVSQFLELRPGDVIATGTCSGVGMARKPPRWMKVGDVCEVEIEKVGTLVNPIVAESMRNGQ
jgi:2-keto-4-pentenoate hydratase/2-oxohepta-3-ene-1,7-dioic acid hydratase in catechol pathway